MNMETFRKEWVPSSCLPKEYGGDLPEFDSLISVTAKQLKTMQPFFDEEEKLRNGHNSLFIK